MTCCAPCCAATNWYRRVRGRDRAGAAAWVSDGRIGNRPRLGLDRLLPWQGPQRRRDLALALIIARLLEPAANPRNGRLGRVAVRAHSPGAVLALGRVAAQRDGYIYRSAGSADQRPHYVVDENGENCLVHLPFHYAIDDADHPDENTARRVVPELRRGRPLVPR